MKVLNRRPNPFLVASMLAALLLWTQTAEAQQPAPKADPSDFGLVLPDAPPKPGGDRRVLVKDQDDQVVVGRVHVEVGDRLLVLLPNGRIISVAAREATPTERPFEPATKDAVIEDLTKDKFKGFRTRTTKRYVYVYNTSEEFREATSRILETMYPALFAYCKRQKMPVEDPEVPLVAIMFRTQEEFDKYREMPEGVVAYYNGVTNYVVMYEQSKLGEIAPDLAVKQSISTIAHEGVHQILHNIGVQQRLSDWPMWISEGLPEYFSPTETGKRIRWKGVGLVNDLRLHSLIEYLKQRGVAAPGELIKETVNAQNLSAEGYAAAWALTSYLAKFQKDNFYAYLREVSEAGPLEKETGQNLELFSKHFGSDLAELETSMIKQLQKIPYVDPIANQTHFVGMLTTPGFRSAVVTTSPAAIRKWQEEKAAELAPADRGRARLQFQAFPNKNAALGFANGWLRGN